MAFRALRVLQPKQIFRQAKSFTPSNSVNVPKGYLSVYVGESQKKRFLVLISFLNQPSFQDLLRISEEEFGFEHPTGGLIIPCSEAFFVNLISKLIR
ncbi:PREDICTED: auxin-responsive protein SAUR21-like [Tarenaya hassleriana]|uniref:auxin-responsive protein SAUR21-like n=1 Tax=Tarenaya hassleriana TaxID=28532 RepID=UPI00053C447B|nr:PREDICTED: auxin-responsive protein SAUR21-like [Tarenaya hassleriana]